MIAIKYFVPTDAAHSGIHTGVMYFTSGPRNLLRVVDEFPEEKRQIQRRFDKVERVWVEIDGVPVEEHDLLPLRLDAFQHEMHCWRESANASPQPESRITRAHQLLQAAKSRRSL